MTERAEQLARYQHLRRVGVEVNNRLVRTLPRDVIQEGGKKLGILQKDTLVLDSEDEIAVLMDYCIHDVRRNGRNAVERYLAESPPPPDSDEMVFLKGLAESRYCLVVVEAAEPDVGVHVHDLLRDEPLFITDVGFSQTARKGMVLATRIIAPEGIVMTSGAALPFGMAPANERTTVLRDFAATLGIGDFDALAPEQMSELTASLIRACRQRGAAEHVEYLEPGSTSRRGRASGGQDLRGPAPAGRIGRNDLCPCGSGKKFKKCCGVRRG